MNGAKIHLRLGELLGSVGGGLRSRVVTDHDESTVIRRHRLYRVRRPNDRESLREERKAQQNAKGERLHIAVSLCIIFAMESPDFDSCGISG